MEILKDYPLKTLNTFGIEVYASRFYQFESGEDLKQLFDSEKNIQTLILGGGSNILFTGNYDGLVALNRIGGIEIMEQTSDYVLIRAGGGVNWHDLVGFCLEKNFGGIENLSLIPGTVGAAPMQNIGAYGVELSEVFVELEALNRQTGKIEIFDNEACHFGYRTSIFKTKAKNKYVILSVILRLTVKDHRLNIEYGDIKKVLKEHDISQPSIRDISNAVIHIRRNKLPDPLEIGNAGSFFKNPIIDKMDFDQLKLIFPGIIGYDTDPGHVKVPAGWLIEQCGWKGKKIGNIGVHEKQALVLVNHGDGKGSDLLALAKDIQMSVRDKFGIELNPEVNII